MSSTELDNLSQREEVFFKNLEPSANQADTIKTLTYDLLMLEAVRGQNAIEIGRKLIKIREACNECGPSVWRKWCDTFVYTKDYANRMIQVAEKFNESMPGVMTLTFRHLREIARFSDTESDLTKLLSIAEDQKLSVHETRFLVSESNRQVQIQGTPINLDELIAEHPDLKTEIERRMKAAKEAAQADSKEQLDKMQEKVRTISSEAEKLEKVVEEKNTELKDFQNKLKRQNVADKLGAGNPELGEIKIKLEQTIHQRDNAQLALEQTQKDLRRVQTDLDRYINSPIGQSKLELKKVVDDITKFFKDTMTPSYVSLKTKRVNTKETEALMLGVVDVVEDWCKEVRQTLKNFS